MGLESSSGLIVQGCACTCASDSASTLRSHPALCWFQNSRHGEKIHAIATGREHRCSGWARLHRCRLTACGPRKRGVNADAGSEFIAPSSQHPSHMPLHLERQGGAETVARQQPWSNREPHVRSSRFRLLRNGHGPGLRHRPVPGPKESHWQEDEDVRQHNTKGIGTNHVNEQ
jgi:hypothetical protein